MQLSFISPTFSFPQRPSRVWAFICALLPPWKHQVFGAGELGRLSPWQSQSPSSSCACVGTPRLLQVRGRRWGILQLFEKLRGTAIFFFSIALLKMHMTQEDRLTLFEFSLFLVLERPRGTMGLVIYSSMYFEKYKY